MSRKLGAILLTAFVATNATASAAQQFTTQKFDIGGEGGFDYLTADPATGRVIS